MFRPISILLALLCPVRGKEIPVQWEFNCEFCAKTLKVDVGDVVKFYQGNGHNVYTMVDAAAYDSCDFSEGMNLGENAQVDVPIVEKDAGKTLYFGCQIGAPNSAFHCTSAKMKIAFEVAPVEKKQCTAKKVQKQNKMEYEHGRKKNLKTCQWLIRKIKDNERQKGGSVKGGPIPRAPGKSVRVPAEEGNQPRIVGCIITRIHTVSPYRVQG
eukprot:CAMPEP_0194265142 /NCGR_PEP_ID=MMETSP0169-20130528/477_1 /TAXON_ID=218684 /ORGANISM="Corethron pennatum, Strain L29A3" /LENGTH=211 /DNA_ID=CAMNT_0039005549 /DNA_START=61 /DNA_END=694 /DNA_ORIENTATION=-